MDSFLQFLFLNYREIFEQVLEHINLTFTSLTFSLIIGLPLGIFLTRFKKLSDLIIGIVSVIQTIPSLALFGFLLPFFGIGAKPAIIALFLYALLPIVRNTYTGIEEVDASVKEAAKGMGMTNFQILTKVELPLAAPVIFAGIRTATVLNVGIATIAAYIGAGGLGNYISRGIALNNTNMILAGAIPAALLAISFDFLLGLVQRFIKHSSKIIVSILILTSVIFISSTLRSILYTPHSFTLGCVPEFMERQDGYKLLTKEYEIKIKTKEMDSQLIFQALQNKEVDLIAGNSTEGRINAYKLRLLEDDKKAFPPYYACPIVQGETLRKYPTLKNIFSKIEGKITNEKMAELNYRVEEKKEPIERVVKSFLKEIGLKNKVTRNGKPDLVIGSKNFTEQFILAEIFALLIENYTNLNVETKKGLAGTKICFEALKKGEINIYPEYTGTGLFVILRESKVLEPHLLYNYVKDEFKKRFDIEWLQPLGFNNTWALIIREGDTKKLMIMTISDLKVYLDNNNEK